MEQFHAEPLRQSEDAGRRARFCRKTYPAVSGQIRTEWNQNMGRERIAIDAWATYVSPRGRRAGRRVLAHFPQISLAEVDDRGNPSGDAQKWMTRVSIVSSCRHYGGQWVLTNRKSPNSSEASRPIHRSRNGQCHAKPMDVARDVERSSRTRIALVRLDLICMAMMTGLPPNDKHYWPVHEMLRAAPR